MKNSEYDKEILAKTIYGEARGEFRRYGLASLIAIANVILNRVEKNFEKNVADVCLAPKQFSCWNANDPNYLEIQKTNINDRMFQICLKVADKVLSGEWPDLTDGCDHYHSRYVKPYWAMFLEPKRVFGSHCFYNIRKRN